jgi:4-amino-4-deoxychorismate lyase
MFFETIRIEDGKIYYIEYHNKRLNQTIYKNFRKKSDIDLLNFIEPPKDGLYRCKVFYDKEIKKIEFFPYTPKKIKSLKLVEANINYPYKHIDRSNIEALIKKDEADDIVIIKNGYITDTSIANIALFFENRWYTPKEPLLKGTTRDRLIKSRFLIPANLTKTDIKKAKKIALMNAMIGFCEVDAKII